MIWHASFVKALVYLPALGHMRDHGHCWRRGIMEPFQMSFLFCPTKCCWPPGRVAVRADVLGAFEFLRNREYFFWHASKICIVFCDWNGLFMKAMPLLIVTQDVSQRFLKFEERGLDFGASRALWSSFLKMYLKPRRMTSGCIWRFWRMNWCRIRGSENGVAKGRLILQFKSAGYLYGIAV